MNLINLAKALRIPAHDQWMAELDQRLVDLRRDVESDATDVGDAHPRFADHVALLTWGGDDWPAFEAAVDRAAAAPDPAAATNRLTRELIDQVRTEM